MYIERTVSGFITNLGKYNEGELVGEWVSFPIDDEEKEAMLKRIGIGEEDDFGCVYEEYFFTDYENYGIDLYELFGEYPNINSLNELGEKVEGLTDSEYKLLCGLLEEREISTLEDILEFNSDDYCFYKGMSKVAVAENEIDEIYPRLPNAIKECIDYERYAEYFMDDYTETSFGTYFRY